MNTRLRLILRVCGVAILGLSVIRLCIVTGRQGHFTHFSSGGFAGDIVVDPLTLGAGSLGLLDRKSVV